MDCQKQIAVQQDQECDKLRTPSGNQINVKFGDIRAIFSPDRYKVSDKANSQDTKITQPLKQRLRSSSHLTDSPVKTSSIVQTVKRKGRQSSNQNKDQLFDLEHLEEVINTKRGCSDSEIDCYFTPPGTPKIVKPVKRSKTEKMEDTAIKESESIQQQHLLEKEATDMDVETTPQNSDVNAVKSLNLEMVMAMFKRLENRLDKFESTDQKAEQQQTNEGANQVSPQIIQQYEAEIKNLKKRNYLVERTNKIAYCAIQDLTKRVSQIELNNTKKAITINGLHIYSEKKEETGKEIADFLEEELALRPLIDDFFFIGQFTPRTIVVYLSSLQEKREILSRKSILKNVTNVEDKPIFISDYWTAESSERKKVEMELAATNDKLPNDKKMAVDYSYAKMLLDGEPWQKKKKVNVPSANDLIDLDMDSLSRVLKMHVTKGKEIKESSSRFIGYSLVPGDYKEIQEAYYKLKLLHPEADHIMCAFYMQESNDIFAQDYCDDGEHGGGRKLLDYLLENRLKQRAVFVVRYFGGIKMNNQRFLCIRQAAIEAVSQSPENEILQTLQQPQSDDPIDLYKPAGSPQGKQRRVREASKKKTQNKTSSSEGWRRGKHVPSYQRGARAGYSGMKNRNRGGRRGSAHRGSYHSRSTRQNTHNYQNESNFSQDRSSRHQSRYENYFGQGNHSDTQSVQHNSGDEHWSEQNPGAFE